MSLLNEVPKALVVAITRQHSMEHPLRLPFLSGVIALILHANPALTWRDVKYILAKTATPVDYVTSGSIAHLLGEATPSGAVAGASVIEKCGGF